MDKINEVLTRRVEQVLPVKKALAQLMRQKKIKVYLGIDPTGTKLHLGHSIPLKKLQEFADLGHESILLIGNGTVLVGDPSNRDKIRPRITQKEIEENIATWKKQAGKILDFSKIKIKYNARWLLNLNLKEIIEIASQISAVQLFKRDMFQKRLQKGNTVWFHETLYPLFQGYDSVAMNVDLEIGGTDQTFNMLIGRELQQKINHKEKFVLIVPMILGTDAKPMSKTSQNCVWLADSPKQMFGKLMSLPDNLTIPYFNLVTDINQQEISQMKKQLKSPKTNPMNLKKKLAFTITAMYHSQNKAQEAQEEFERIFQSRGVPKRIKKSKIKNQKWNIIDLLINTKMAPSKSEAKRLVNQKAVEINQAPITNYQLPITIRNGDILKVGKHKFVHLALTN